MGKNLLDAAIADLQTRVGDEAEQNGYQSAIDDLVAFRDRFALAQRKGSRYCQRCGSYVRGRHVCPGRRKPAAQSGGGQ